MKINSLKHLWETIAIAFLKNKIVREDINITTIKKIGRATYFLRDEDAYIVVTTEMDSAHVLKKNPRN